MTIIHSSDLGWTAGQDISEEFAALAKTLQPGDVFVFDHMYTINAQNIQLADNVTLAGGAPGAGLDVLGTKAHENPLLILGNSNTLVDLTITHSDTSSADGPFNNGATIHAFGDNIQVLNSSFEGWPKEFIRAGGDGFSVVDTVFDGSYYQMRWHGEATNFLVENSLFQNSTGDGIKTARHKSGFGTEDATISNSVFINNTRDGIDTTSGFKGSLITDSYFINNDVAALDFKTILERPSDLNTNTLNQNITITNTEFTGDQDNIIVATLLNRLEQNGYGDLVTPDLEEIYTPNNIHISDSLFENHRLDAGFSASFLIKDGYDFSSTNNQYLGNIRVPDETYDSFSSISGTTTGSARTQQPDSYYQSLAGPDWSSISYPVDGTQTPTDPVEDPVDPVEDPVDPVEDPVDPVEDDASVTNPSDLLDIFVAYTDTDETISQLGNGSSIDSSLTDGRSLTIYATTKGEGAEVGSVKLTVDGVGSRMENVAPYALFGDNGSGDFFGGKELPEGTYTAELVVFDGKNGSGNILETVAFDFTVGSTASAPIVEDPVDPDPVVEDPVDPDPVVEDPVDPDPVADPAPVVELPETETDLAPDSSFQGPYSQLLDIKLFDTSTDTLLVDLHQGAKLSSSDLSGRKITLSAETIESSSTDIGSVKLEMDGQYTKMENVAPYALFGDNGKGNFFGGKQLADGIHTVTLTAYSDKNGKGSVLEEVTVSFEVGDYDSVFIDGSPSAVSSYSASQDTGTATVSSDQSAIMLDGSAWKSLDVFEEITETTTLKFDFKSDAEGEIQGIGFINEDGDLESTFFQLDGSQTLGIQDFNDAYETGSGFHSYTIHVGQYFTGAVSQLVLVSDDDAERGAMSTFDNISLIEAIV